MSANDISVRAPFSQDACTILTDLQQTPDELLAVLSRSAVGHWAWELDTETQ